MNKLYPNLTDEEVNVLNRIEAGQHGKKVLADLMNRAIGGAAVAATALQEETDPTVLSFESAASAGGSATETMTVTGLLATDEIIGVTLKTAGANPVSFQSYANQANDALDVTFSGDPGVGAIVEVTVKRA